MSDKVVHLFGRESIHLSESDESTHDLEQYRDSMNRIVEDVLLDIFGSLNHDRSEVVNLSSLFRVRANIILQSCIYIYDNYDFDIEADILPCTRKNFRDYIEYVRQQETPSGGLYDKQHRDIQVWIQQRISGGLSEFQDRYTNANHECIERHCDQIGEQIAFYIDAVVHVFKYMQNVYGIQYNINILLRALDSIFFCILGDEEISNMLKEKYQKSEK